MVAQPETSNNASTAQGSMKREGLARESVISGLDVMGWPKFRFCMRAWV